MRKDAKEDLGCYFILNHSRSAAEIDLRQKTLKTREFLGYVLAIQNSNRPMGTKNPTPR